MPLGLRRIPYVAGYSIVDLPLWIRQGRDYEFYRPR